jgi:hypothetical protein
MPFHPPPEFAAAQPAALRLCISTPRLEIILISAAFSRHDVRLVSIVLSYD